MELVDFLARAMLTGAVGWGALAAVAAQDRSGDEQAVLAADAQALAAAEAGDRAALEALTDADFTWVDPAGLWRARDSILNAIPRPVFGSSSGARPEARSYGPDLVVVQRHGAAEPVAHSMHIWARRPAGWRLLHIIELVEGARAVYGGTTVNVPDCINPCRTVPFVPATPVEKAVIEAWQEQASSPEGWRRRVADDNIGRSSNGSYTKADRWAVITRQVREGVSASVAPLLWARMWEFRDAVFMFALQTRTSGKPFWVSRVFVNRGGLWQMAESYQTTVRDAPPF